MLKQIGFATGAEVAMIVPPLVGTATMAGAAPNQGVTPTTIKVGAPSLGPGQAYAIGPVFVGKFDAATNQLVFSTKSAS